MHRAIRACQGQPHILTLLMQFLGSSFVLGHWVRCFSVPRRDAPLDFRCISKFQKYSFPTLICHLGIDADEDGANGNVQTTIIWPDLWGAELE